MLLCVDIGNTNITLGLYEGENLGPRRGRRQRDRETRRRQPHPPHAPILYPAPSVL